MPSEYHVNNVDFDVLLEPKLPADPLAAATGYAVGGADLNTLYAPASVGTAYGNLGYAQSGVDIGPRFAARNSRRLPVDGDNFTTSDIALTGEGSVFAGLYLNLGTNGLYEVQQVRGTSAGTIAASGTWNAQGGASSGYEVLFTITHLGGDTVAAVSGAGGWFNLGTGRSCSHTIGAYPGNQASEHESQDRFRMQIRRAADTVVVADATFTSTLFTAGFA